MQNMGNQAYIPPPYAQNGMSQPPPNMGHSGGRMPSSSPQDLAWMVPYPGGPMDAQYRSGYAPQYPTHYNQNPHFYGPAGKTKVIDDVSKYIINIDNYFNSLK